MGAGLWLACAVGATAGGGPQNVLVVINDASPVSREVGLTYARGRGIDQRQILHLTNSASLNLPLADFSNSVRNVILTYLAASGLSNQVDYVVFGPDFPYRIYDSSFGNLRHAGLTSTLFYDFYSSPSAFTTGCQVATGSSNAYYAAERAFARAESPGGRYLLAGLLQAWHGDEARRLVQRARAADGSLPTGRTYLVHTTDAARSVRWKDFEEADFRSRLAARPGTWFRLDGDGLGGIPNIVGYFTGIAVAGDVLSPQYVPGAYSDHLTSYGGFLFDSSQMSILQWIRAGCAGSYGTVVEPCNFTEKYPDPRLYAWYERGFTLGESLYMSVRNPYQGVFVGDPLTAPYAVTSQVTLLAPAPLAVVAGVVTVEVEAVATSTQRPVSRVDLFVDELWAATLTNLGTRAGNVFEIVVNEATGRYTAVSDASLYTVATGLAAAVNAGVPGVRATAQGDSVQLVHTNYGVSGASNLYRVAAGIGTAAVLQAGAFGLSTQFMDTLFPAREFLGLTNSADAGDVLRCLITLTNGVVATNEITATASESAHAALGRLRDTINTNSALTGSDGVVAKYLETVEISELSLEARAAGPRGYNLHVDFQVIPNPGPPAGFVTNWSFSDFFNDNGSVLRPRALVRLVEGATNLAARHAWSTTNLPDGPHLLRAVAYEGTAVRVQGHALAMVRVQNHALACAITNPAAGRYFEHGAGVTTEVLTAGSAGTVTQVTLFVEGKRAGADTSPPFAVAWSTTNTGLGVVGLQARADSDAGEATLSERVEVVVYRDADGDGMSDQWEYEALGSATNFGGAADTDSDGRSNRDEFLADTDPSNAASRLQIESIIAPEPFAFSFASRTTRVYRVGLQDGSLEASPWTAATGAFTTVAGSTPWSDTPTNAPPATNTYRLFRVETALP
jgi:uncharacterized protein (TIGR03790 family)